MFKDIISRDEGEPWGSSGMTSATWLTVPVSEVPISELIATQNGIYFHALREDHEHLHGDPYPHVIKWDGEYYLEDGHHRVVKAALRGAQSVIARVLSL